MAATGSITRWTRGGLLRPLLMLGVFAWLALWLAPAHPVGAVGPNAVRAGFDANTLLANDDGSTGAIPLQFQHPINFFNQTYANLFVNNNGNITFDAPLGTYTPFNLTSTNSVIIAPFFADVDTTVSGSSPVKYGYGVGLVDGHNAFGVTYQNVAYYGSRDTRRNSFQVVLIDRSDIADGAFDIELNYDQIQWESGTASGGVGGLGGSSARAGFSNGTGAAGTSYELPGSAVNGAFLDSNTSTGLIRNSRDSNGQLGRYVFRVRNGQPQTEICDDNIDNDEDTQTDEFCRTPTALSGGPYSVAEGSLVALNGSGTDPDDGDSLTYAWDLDNNGSFETPGASATFSAASLDGPDTRTVRFSALDRAGNQTVATTTVAITNVAPTPTIAGAPPSVSYGATLNLSASATDPGTADTASGFSYAWSVTRDGAPTAHTGAASDFSFIPSGVGSYVVTLTATDNDGGSGTITATIAVATTALTVTADPATRAYGAANPTLTAGYSGFVLGDDRGALTGDLSCATTATAASPVGSYAIDCSASTLASPNYAIGYVTGTLTVTTASTTTAAGDASGIVGASATLTATVTNPDVSVNEGTVEFTIKRGGATVGSPVTGAVTGGSATASFSLIGVAFGNYDIEARYLPAASGNFAASADPTPGRLTVSSPTHLSVSGSGTYGDPATLTATLTDVGGAPLAGRIVQFTLNGSSVCGITPACPLTDASGIATLAGVPTTGLQGSTPYSLAASYAGDASYEATGATGSLTLDRASQTISFSVLANATYGDGPTTLVATASSGLPVAYSTSGSCRIEGNQVQITGAGSCTVTAAQIGDGNYLAASSVDRTFIIARKALSVRPADQTVKFGAPPPCAVASGYPVGLAYNDTLASLGGTLTCASVPAVPPTVGTYPLHASGLTSENYTISYIAGKLAVVACPVQLTLDPPPTGAATYSDRLTLTARVINCGGSVYPTGTVQFRLSGAIVGSASLNAQGVATLPLQIMNDVGERPLAATVTPSDIRFTGASAAPQNLIVVPEEATAEYTGKTSFAVNNATRKGTVQLAATVKDITASDPMGDPYAGDIRTARVRFERPDGSSINPACDSVAVTLVNASDKKIGTASCSFQSPAASFEVRVVVLGNYTGRSAGTKTIVVGGGSAGATLPAAMGTGALWREESW